MTDEMNPQTGEFPPVLPGFEQGSTKKGEPGFVEAATLRMIEKLEADGWITVHHAGPCALAIVTARRVDSSEGRGAPSGQANLLRAMKEIFELLPTPENASSDALDKALEFMTATESMPSEGTPA